MSLSKKDLLQKRLPHEYYLQEDTVAVAKDLLGKVLCTDVEGHLTAGRIVETEAYHGIIDRASHAYGGRHTSRTKTMYEQGGIAYVYLCYGIHHLFNVVMAPAGQPHAVLIRGVEPLAGVETMLARRGKERMHSTLTSGPGSLSAALGITTALDGTSLLGPTIWIADEEAVPKEEIIASPRVGVAYAKEHAQWPFRFRIRGNKWTSPAK